MRTLRNVRNPVKQGTPGVSKSLKGERFLALLSVGSEVQVLFGTPANNAENETVYLVTLEVMVLLIQFMTTVILQNVFFGFLSFLPFVAAIGGFEYAYQKKASSATEKTKNFRKKFYKISAWLGLYFPIRFIVSVAARFYPRPYNVLVLEVIILAIYIAAAKVIRQNLTRRNRHFLPFPLAMRWL